MGSIFFRVRVHARTRAFGAGRRAWLRGLLLALCLNLCAQAAQAALKIGVSDWPGWVAWYIAEQRGLFRKYGADVKLVWFSSYTDSITALERGRIDANSQTWPDTLAQRARGAAVKAVLVNDNSAGNDAIVARGHIDSVAALKGRTVALEQYSVSHFVLATALERHHLRLGDIRLINLSAAAAAAALHAGRVDAAVLWNPWVLELEQSGSGKAIFTSREMPGLIADLLVARESVIQARRAELMAVVRAWYEVEKFLRDRPVEALASMSKAAGVKASDYALLLPGTRFFDAAANRDAFDSGQPQGLLAVAPAIDQYLRQVGLAGRGTAPAEALDASFVLEVAALMARGARR
ncbi:MAG: ABC transporter substrate-binding protein [Rhodocyclaceae bacterium]|nr:ABC transporter substrate-binding protein [Rhodocyclaceae bacterium]